jgi:hypothetical protein
VALVVAIVLFYRKPLLPSQYTFLVGVEDTNQAYSWLNFWIRSLRQGTPPLWDPYATTGYSFPGEMQTAAFNPLHLPLLQWQLGRFPIGVPSLFALALSLLPLLPRYKLA